MVHDYYKSEYDIKVLRKGINSYNLYKELQKNLYNS
mgnify:CR=1 FL=1